MQKNKLVVFVVGLFMVISLFALVLPVKADVVVVAQYSSALRGGSGWGLAGINYASAQTFNVVNGAWIETVRVYGLTEGSPVGVFGCRIEGVSGNWGTTDAPNGTVYAVSTNTFTQTAFNGNPMDFSFNGSFYAPVGQKLAIVMYVVTATTLDAVTNYVRFGVFGDGVLAGSARQNNGGGWGASASYSCVFTVLGSSTSVYSGVVSVLVDASSPVGTVVQLQDVSVGTSSLVGTSVSLSGVSDSDVVWYACSVPVGATFNHWQLANGSSVSSAVFHTVDAVDAVAFVDAVTAGYYNITAWSDVGCSVVPNGTSYFAGGSSVTYYFQSTAVYTGGSYNLVSVVVNGSVVKNFPAGTTSGSYSFYAISGNSTLYVNSIYVGGVSPSATPTPTPLSGGGFGLTSGVVSVFLILVVVFVPPLLVLVGAPKVGVGGFLTVFSLMLVLGVVYLGLPFWILIFVGLGVGLMFFSMANRM